MTWIRRTNERSLKTTPRFPVSSTSSVHIFVMNDSLRLATITSSALCAVLSTPLRPIITLPSLQRLPLSFPHSSPIAEGLIFISECSQYFIVPVLRCITLYLEAFTPLPAEILSHTFCQLTLRKSQAGTAHIIFSLYMGTLRESK